MDELLISGGNPLRGSVEISGAKNAALPAIAAAILAPGTTVLDNMPYVNDVNSMCRLIETLGGETAYRNHSLSVDAQNITAIEAPYDLVRKMRASVLLLGPLLARFGHARVSRPGGCAIGNRPIDIHLKAMKALGADVSLDHGMIDVSASQLRGAEIYLDFPTVTGTENVLMAAMGAKGKTIIHNAAEEPEVVDLSKLLTKMGAEIIGAGTDTIRINPPREPVPCRHKIIPDRIEAGTYAVAAVMTRGRIEIINVIPEHLTAPLAKLKEAGASIKINRNRDGLGSIVVSASDSIRSVDIQTEVYPGYPTDLQAQFMAMMCLADGESIITENIFENRFMHVAELNRMGADISTRGRNAFVKGVDRLNGTSVMATDLRASACLVLGGLVAVGETRVLRIYHLDRGYDGLEKKLISLGADIKRIKGDRV